jgi:hypothetical protein
MTNTTTKWPAAVIRVRTTNGKFSYVQPAEWHDKNCVLLREMQANGWPRKSNISRGKIAWEAGEARSVHKDRGC